MKNQISWIIAAFTCFVSISVLAGDKFGMSAQEMERVKELNKSKVVVSLSDDELRKLMVGKWTTGRHEYIYKADGTWRMLPLDISTTNGTWRIENRQLIEENGVRTFIEASPKRLILRNEDGPYPYQYIRIE